MIENSITINSLSFSYGKNLTLDDINLEIKKGCIQGIIGSNGAGKSTLINILVGRLKPSKGSVHILGSSPEVKLLKNIGFMPQKNSIYENLNVYENIDFFARMQGLSNKNHRKITVKKIIDTVHLKNMSKEIVYKLSGGMKQRVSLAIALVHKPKILIFDEPTVGLDPELRRTFWNNFKNLSSKGTTIIITTHTMDDAIHCDKLAYMKSGKILINQPPEKFLDTNKNIYSLEDAFIKLSVGKSNEVS